MPRRSVFLEGKIFFLSFQKFLFKKINLKPEKRAAEPENRGCPFSMKWKKKIKKPKGKGAGFLGGRAVCTG